MDLRKLKTLVDLVSESGICELEVTEGEDKVRIVNKPSMMAPNMQMNMPANYNHHYVQDSANYTTSKPLNVQPLEVDAQDVVDLKNAMNSPMVGSFYRASSPGNPPFVNVGDSFVHIDLRLQHRCFRPPLDRFVGC